MPEYCHRCGEELPGGASDIHFCPNCGAPQLHLSCERQSEPSEEASSSTGEPPPPRVRQVEWRPALGCALTVGLVAAALSLAAVRIEMLSALSLLWTLSASMIALALYQRRRPSAWMDAGIGARIGIAVGLALTLALGFAMAVWSLTTRFLLHSMEGFDRQMQAQVDQAIQHSASPIPASMLGFLHSPEFRAGILLAGFAMLAGMLLVTSTLFGAFGGLLRRRDAPAA